MARRASGNAGAGGEVKRGRRVIIGGRRWRIVVGGVGPGLCGECDYDARTIHIDESLRGGERLDTVIHEITHAAFPWLSEEAVEQFGTELAVALQRWGYGGE